ncbi:50S ribosomal protein L25 [candidate division WWE3 bacterium]|jgi:large subunit ribosomal protein L25|uniref:Large ribosomal subunit protein bL25 n=1 Tax=candidate division WWE3 bacterium TaxID=2053526 RepID=A0A3A4ZC62_UNCKA|nr:MAG: 50S ribosomal protein L25 [candidate division WWE3 bacterium]
MELTGQKREKTGKQTKSLRKTGIIPAVVYGNDITPSSIQLNLNEFIKVYGEIGETGLIDLKLEKETHKILINDVQYDPISGRIIHTGLYKPNLKEKTEVEVPVEIIGEAKNPLLKSGGAILLTLLNEVRVSALPTDLPDAFVVDVSGLLEPGAGITVAELKYDKGKVEIVDSDPEELVVKLDVPTMEEPEEEVPVTEEEAIAQMEATEEKEEDEEEASEKAQE